MSRYTLQPKRNNMPLVETIHETWIDAPSKAAFQALAAAQGLSMRAALAQLIEQHAQIREPFSPRRPTPWTGEAAKGESATKPRSPVCRWLPRSPWPCSSTPTESAFVSQKPFASWSGDASTPALDESDSLLGGGAKDSHPEAGAEAPAQGLSSPEGAFQARLCRVLLSS